VRDPKTGEPTGILKDERCLQFYRIMPDDSEEDRLTAARAALGEARRWGVTSVQDSHRSRCENVSDIARAVTSRSVFIADCPISHGKEFPR